MRQRPIILYFTLPLTVVVALGLLVSVWAKQDKSEKNPKPVVTTFEGYRIILNKQSIFKLQNGVFRVNELRIPLDTEEGEHIKQTIISDLSSNFGSEKAQTYHHELRFRIYDCNSGKARTFKTSYFSESEQIYETPTAELGGENGPPFQTLNKVMVDSVCK